MALRTVAAVKNAAVDAAAAKANGGKIQFWSGTRPASPDAAPAGTKLIEVALSATAFGAAASGSATANGLPLSTTGLADGTIGFARVVDSQATPAGIWDEDSVGTSGTKIVVNTLTVSTGVAFSVTDYKFTASDPA